MAETPAGYFCDLFVQWNIQHAQQHGTEINTARNGREQRRAFLPASGIRRFVASGDALTQANRRAVASFLQTQRGRYGAFYFWNPPPQIYNDVSVGSVSAQSRIVIPYRITNPSAAVSGSLTDVRVGGLTTGFSLNHTTPRTGAFTSLKFLPTGGNYVDCGTSAALRTTGDMAGAAWIYVFNLSVGPVIFNSDVFQASGFIFSVNTNGALFIATDQAGARTSGSSSGAIAAGAWYHVGFSRSGTTVTFYINGVAAGTATGINNPVTATRSFEIGYQQAASVHDHMVSDVRWYNFAISGAEMMNIYNGNASSSAGLHGWWKLDEGTGTTAKDSSGFGNTGTLTNSPQWVGGEEEVVFSGNQTGALTATGTMRERIVARFDSDAIVQRFIQDATDIRAIFDLALKEVI